MTHVCQICSAKAIDIDNKLQHTGQHHRNMDTILASGNLIKITHSKGPSVRWCNMISAPCSKCQNKEIQAFMGEQWE